MKFEGAKVKEQGVTFGIVVVKSHVLNSPSERTNMMAFGQQAWGAIPIVLMAQDMHGTATYWGRPDIVKFLANIDPRRIPWGEWTIAA